MKFFLLFLISLPVYSNTFQLVDSGARFTLKISKSELAYNSEALSKTFKLKDCSLPLAKDLNSEILALLPAKPSEKGFKFLVDGKEIQVSKEDKLSSKILAMDSRMIRFTVEEKAACK